MRAFKFRLLAVKIPSPIIAAKNITTNTFQVCCICAVKCPYHPSL